VGINETVTFSAVNSTSDGRIDYYSFDFGDGSNSSWTPLSVVTHAYLRQGTYYATVTVMDDYGLTSNNTQQIKVQIIVVPEFPSCLILPLFMIATLVAVFVFRKKRKDMISG
jgi:PKD repeat protein